MDTKFLASQFYGPNPRWFRYLIFNGVVLSETLPHSFSVVDFFFFNLLLLVSRFYFCYNFISGVNTSHFSWLLWHMKNTKNHTRLGYTLNHQFLSVFSSWLLLIILKASINLLDWMWKNTGFLIWTLPSLCSFSLHKTTKFSYSESFTFGKGLLVL